MNKVIKMGNDFSDESEATDHSEKVAKETDEESEEEKENSAESTDSKNKDDDSKEDESEEESEEEEEESSESEEEKEEESDEKTKERELQGLLNTEGDLNKDLGTIDEKIEAARKRISDKRKARREGRELTENIDSALPKDSSEDTDDLSDVDPDTLKLLERFTKAKGLVPKSELTQLTYKEQHKTAEQAFYDKHPEYSAENDTDDVLYKALKTELSLYAAPSDSKLISKLFEKAHASVAQMYPDKFKKISSGTEMDKKKVVAKSARLKSQALGGGASGGGSGGGSVSGKSSGGKSFDGQQLQALRDGGWSDAEIKELTSK